MGKIFSHIFSNILHNETDKKAANGCAKKEIMRERKKDMPFLSNDDLAKEFGIGKSTVQGILVKSSKWLSINEVSIMTLHNIYLYYHCI